METFENRGWKFRRKVAIAKNEEWNIEERLAVRAEREKLYEAEATANRLAAEIHAAEVAASRCSCPACDGGGVLSARDAVRVIEALGRFGFQGFEPTEAGVNALVAMLRGIEPAFGSNVLEFRNHAHRPRPIGKIPAKVAESIETVTSKSTRKGPEAADDEEFTYDGALIEP